jgi:hypothetical protein
MLPAEMQSWEHQGSESNCFSSNTRGQSQFVFHCSHSFADNVTIAHLESISDRLAALMF